jgi:hypothetical protein
MDEVNSILQSGGSEFICPILHQKITWEEKDVSKFHGSGKKQYNVLLIEHQVRSFH